MTLTPVIKSCLMFSYYVATYVQQTRFKTFTWVRDSNFIENIMINLIYDSIASFKIILLDYHRDKNRSFLLKWPNLYKKTFSNDKQ